ncbi:hypothetical protein AnigIFM62618_006810 [Aspergillus niger]|nr:hypothetical protein AnigIFM62618_006810 [Aspergillus niger]
MIDKWPSAGAVVNRSRVPSCIAYADDNRYIRTTKWGFQVKSSHVAAAWTKLHLETGVIDRVTEDNDDGWADTVGIFRQPGGRDPIHIAKDFLESVREHIEPQIKLACKYASLTVLPLFYVFIVPATWSEGAVEKTREAAYLANFSRKQRGKDLLFVTEPEAALTALLAIGNLQTEDVGTFEIHRRGEIGAYRKIGAFTEPQGGSTMIDRAFYSLCSDMIPDIEDLKLTDTSPASEMMQHFEKAKCDFTGDTSSGPTYLPYTRDGKAQEPLELKSLDMLRIQAPVIMKVCSILEEQIREANQQLGGPRVKHVYMCGGASCSEYLRCALRQNFAGEQIEIHYPEAPMDVVAEGAALWAYNRLRSRIALHHHYGLESSGTETDAMFWLFRKGEDCDIGSQRDFTVPCKISQRFPCMVIKIYDSGDDAAPARAPGSAFYSSLYVTS